MKPFVAAQVDKVCVYIGEREHLYSKVIFPLNVIQQISKEHVEQRKVECTRGD